MASLPLGWGWVVPVAIAWGAGAWIRVNVRHRYKLPAHPDRRDQAVGYSVQLTRCAARPAEEIDGAELLSRWAQRGVPRPVIYSVPPADRPGTLAQDFESKFGVKPPRSAFHV
jgi:hypothetical protein